MFLTELTKSRPRILKTWSQMSMYKDRFIRKMQLKLFSPFSYHVMIFEESKSVRVWQAQFFAAGLKRFCWKAQFLHNVHAIACFFIMLSKFFDRPIALKFPSHEIIGRREASIRDGSGLLVLEYEYLSIQGKKKWLKVT